MTGTYDFADQAVIDALPVREEPHWHVIRFCRHIGVAKTLRSEPQWVARFRTKTGGYRQKRLGLMFGDRALSYAEAMERASAWFAATSNAAIASDPYDRGSKQDLDYCPWGPVFTIGHAMRDLVAWKRLAARKSTFDGHLSQINHHILPRIGTLPVAEFKGHQIKQFILDVLETPPKRGNQLRGSRRPFASLNEEELRSRKGTVNVLVGIVAAQGVDGLSSLKAHFHRVMGSLPEHAAEALQALIRMADGLVDEIERLEGRILDWHRSNDASCRLATIPGIGPITAGAIAANVPDASLFKTARQFAAWLGLTPRANSSGGKERQMGISKQGDAYSRLLQAELLGTC